MEKIKVKELFKEYGLRIDMNINRAVFIENNEDFNFSPEDPIQNINFQIYLLINDDYEDILIGEINITNFNSQSIFVNDMELEDVFLSADDDSGDLGTPIAAILDILEQEDDDDSIYEYGIPNICVIGRFYIDPDYRECGIGTYLFKNLIKIISSSTYYSVEPDFLVAIVTPEHRTQLRFNLTDDEIKKRKNIIIHTASKIGFEIYDNPNSKDTIIYKKVLDTSY